MIDLKNSKVTEPIPSSEKRIMAFFFAIVFGGWLVINLI